MPTPVAELKASLEAHNAEFEALLRLIPAKYYLVPDDTGEQSSKYQKNRKKQNAPKQAVKEASKKAMRDKFDPANNKSIVELQEEAEKKEKGKKRPDVSGATSKMKGKEKAQMESGSEIDELELDVEGIDVDDDQSGMHDDDGNNGGSAPEEEVEYKPMAASGSIETLRAKLRARMEELRQKKGPAWNAGGKDELLEERRQQRATMRERRRKETKEKKRREEEERGKKSKGKEKQAVHGPQTKNQLIVPDVNAHTLPSHDPASKYTNVAFSVLSGTAPTVSKSLKTASNPTQALAQLAKRAEARSALPAEKRKEIEERDAWAKAGARVAGVKVHDDASRLQKAVRRREMEKTKSKKGWDARKEQLVAAQAAKQKKRGDNIAMRNERRKGGAKGGAGKKDAKRRPGFEGKSFGGGGAKKAAAGGKGKGGK